MTFSEISSALISGERVRRASWRKLGGYIICGYEGMSMHVGGVVTVFSLNTLGLLADDWEVVSDTEGKE